jgi:hypothetical protein
MWRLDLDDVRAEPRQQLRRVRQRLHLLEREHADAFEGFAEVNCCGVRRVSE